MSDYIAAEITIGGKVKPSLVRPLCRAICQQRVALDWGEAPFQPETTQDLLAACADVNGVKLLKLCDDQARWGQFEELEWFLERHQIAFRRHSDGRYEYDSDLLEYPESLARLFDVTWDYPSIEPPPYLQQLSPELYRQECRRVAARFDEAIQLAEQAFVEELSRLVSHLTERLSGNEDGKPKVFRDSAVENLAEFFDRFRHLNLRCSEELDGLVNQAQRIVRGVWPQDLRNNSSLRNQVATQLSGVQATLDGLLVDRPRRNILRRPR